MGDFWFGILVGVSIVGLIIVYLLRRVNEIVAQAEIEYKRSNSPLEMTVDCINGVFYGWTKTGEFVCQGTSLEEFQQHFAARFPQRNAIITDGKQFFEKMKNESSSSIGLTS